FAPVNDAFLALGDYELAVLFEEGTEALLGKILTFHVVAGRVLAGDLTDGGTATTVQGGTLTFDLSDASDPRVNGISITTTDIEVANGVIHLVDEVILPPLDIVETAALEISTATLVDAVAAAELADALSAEGPFTVFAPANAGFENLGPLTVQNLLDPANQAILKDVLQYHVIAGDIRSTDLSDGQTATTLEGGEVTFDLSGATPQINGVNITVTDIVTENGVIHIIDDVLTQSMDIVQRATITPPTGTLVAAIEAASANSSTDVASVLSGPGPYTVFAPLDDAFAALGSDRLDVLLDPANADLLAKILTYHVVPGDIRSSDLSDGQTVTTLEGSELTFDLSDPTRPKVNGINLNTTDIVTENGVIHLVEGVLTQNLDLVDVATVEGFSTLVGLVEQQGLTETLRGDNAGDGYTVFAPTNDAFAALSSVPSGDDLTNTLLYHVVPATVAAGDLTDGQVVSTAFSGHDFTVDIDGSVTITDESGNTVNVTVTDVAAANGLIHVIDAVLIPAP
ncbi:MAG: fasciclin domain-containing protein, partial [Longimicrobiales bacterium]|nr:fasciclin domain-containing protein [Longimicrobiales bacterium]